MKGIFKYSSFNGDISKWDTSKVTDFSEAFSFSTFNNDISKWDISNAKYVSYMFHESCFKQNLSSWDFKTFPFDQYPYINAYCFNTLAEYNHFFSQVQHKFKKDSSLLYFYESAKNYDFKNIQFQQLISFLNQDKIVSYPKIFNYFYSSIPFTSLELIFNLKSHSDLITKIKKLQSFNLDYSFVNMHNFDYLLFLFTKKRLKTKVFSYFVFGLENNKISKHINIRQFCTSGFEIMFNNIEYIASLYSELLRSKALKT